MRYYIIINILDNKKSTVTVNYNEDKEAVIINLFINLDEKIDGYLTRKSLVKYSILTAIKNRNLDNGLDTLCFINELDDSILLDDETIIFMKYFSGINNFIKNNSILQQKCIFLMDKFDVNDKILSDFINEFGEDCNCLFKINGNHNYISLDEYRKTVYAIDDIVNKIKKYKLSPIEQIMYAYDLVRERIYNMEDEGESKTLSRDLTSVLLGDKIVCLGYSRIFSAVLNSLGIKDNIFYLISNEKKPGHARNMVYVQDEKYGIDGVYYFDLTFDSKDNKDDTNFLNSYRFFCCSKRSIDRYTFYVNTDLRDLTFSNYFEESLFEFEKIVTEEGIGQVPEEMITVFNSVSMFIDNKNIITNDSDFDEVNEELERYYNLFFHGDLEKDILLEILFNVRKIEYMEDPDKYPLDVDIFRKILMPADGDGHWEYLDSTYNCYTRDDFKKDSSLFELPLRIKEIELAKVLQKTLVKKINGKK